MKKYGLCCPIRRANPYRKMKNAMKTNNYAPNLLDREFESYGPRLVLLTDITYIPWGGIFPLLPNHGHLHKVGAFLRPQSIPGG